MDLKMHVYSVPLRSPFAFPCVTPLEFWDGGHLWPEIRGGVTQSPASYYTLTTNNEVGFGVCITSQYRTP